MFKKLLTILFIPCALVACTPITTTELQYATTKPVADGTLIDEKGFYIAEAAFAGVSQALESAVDGGILKGPQASKVLIYYNRAKEALDVARKVHTKANNENVLMFIAGIWPMLHQGTAPKP